MAAKWAASGEDGYYRFPLLRVGTYQITASASGFKQFDQTGVSLAVGQKARIDIAMQLGANSETVTVTADAPMAETGQATVGAVLSQKEVEDLPIASRNVYNYFLLAPGVQGLSSNTFGTTQFAFGGTERTSWNLDGLDNTQRGGSRLDSGGYRRAPLPRRGRATALPLRRPAPDAPRR